MKQKLRIILNAAFAAHIQGRPEDLTYVLFRKINRERLVYEIPCIAAVLPATCYRPFIKCYLGYLAHFLSFFKRISLTAPYLSKNRTQACYLAVNNTNLLVAQAQITIFKFLKNSTQNITVRLFKSRGFFSFFLCLFRILLEALVKSIHGKDEFIREGGELCLPEIKIHSILLEL